MITKDQLLASMRHETKVMQHLATKVPPGTYDWRPTPAQRSTLELMKYLTTCGSIGVSFAVTGTWDMAQKLETEAESVTPETFHAAMDRQMARAGAGAPSSACAGATGCASARTGWCRRSWR